MFLEFNLVYLSMLETKKLHDFCFQELAHEIFHTVLSMIALIQREFCHTSGEGIDNIKTQVQFMLYIWGLLLGAKVLTK